MKLQEIMHEINQVLDDIVTRTLEINKKNVSGDSLLDIDLVKDDIKNLYRRLDLLRSFISDHTSKEAHSGAPSPKNVKTSVPDHENRPADIRQPESEPLQESAKTPESEENISDPGMTRMKSGGEPDPDYPDDSPAKPEISNRDNSRQDKESQKKHSKWAAEQQQSPQHPPAASEDGSTTRGNVDNIQQQSGYSADWPEAQKHTPAAKPGLEQHQDKPGAHQKPVKGDYQGQQTQKTSQANAKKSNGNRAVIDILSEYSDRTIGDTYLKEQDDSLHNRISEDKEDKSIGERMQKQPIANLKDAIGINEKFLFINELFDGNIQDYQDAIAKLNDMEDARKAFDYLNTLGVENAWDASRSADTIEKLAQLVQRRYL